MSSIVIVRSTATDEESLSNITTMVNRAHLAGKTHGCFAVASFEEFKKTLKQGLSNMFTAEDLDTWSDEQLVEAFTNDNGSFAGLILIPFEGDNDVPNWVVNQARLVLEENVVADNSDVVDADYFTIIHDEFPAAPPPHVNREMRKITRHLVDGESTQLTVHVADEPGSGGAHHLYLLDGFDFRENPSMESLKDLRFDSNIQGIFFQNGPVKESVANGITCELLLALVIDRLECFQSGPYACMDNAVALEHTAYALETLQQRTKRRIAQGVEGQRVQHTDVESANEALTIE